MAQSTSLTRRGFLALLGMAGASASGGCATPSRDRKTAKWIGYTQFRTNLPGSRYANEITSRAYVARTDGSEGHAVAGALTRDANTWSQFAGWSPDGAKAVILSGMKPPEEGAWENEHKTFRFSDAMRLDVYLLDSANGATQNLTAIESVSNYNSGLLFMPGAPPRLGFTALIGGVSHPFSMDMDGRNKRDLSTSAQGFTYGFSASPDGALIAYHKDYQIYIANADGSNARHIETGHPFNFAPQWSPDGKWVLFVSGEHHDCDPHIVARDGTGLRKAASRGGYKGWVAVYDVEDFHDGSSDIPAWAADSRGLYFTKVISDRVELCWGGLDGGERQLTHSAPGVLHYHPGVSPNDGHVLFGSTRDGRRQLYAMPADGGEVHRITNVPPGYGAMWGHWQP